MKIPRSLLFNRLISFCRLVLLVAAIALPAIALPFKVFAQGNSSTPRNVSAYLPLLVHIESEQPGQPDSKPPVIKSFTATPAVVAPGGKATLIWQVSGADTVSIQPALGVLSGASVEVSPATTTEYSLTATNAHGATTAKATVTVQAAGNDFQYNTFLLPYDIDKNAFVSKVPQLRIDQNNGVHVIYTASYPDDTGARPAYYAYCPANCTSASAFNVIHLGDEISFAQLALDPQGRPRVLLASDLPADDIGTKMHWTYGACNSNCTNAANWTLTEIAVARY